MNLPEFRLEAFFARWEFAARFHLTASDVESMALGELLRWGGAEAEKAWRELSLGYIPTEGTEALRQAIACTYDHLEADQILVFCGAEEGLYCAMHALLTSSDHAIVTVPNYQSMEELPLKLAGKVSALVLRPEHDWAPDLDALRRLIQPQTRLLAVNFPNNPTGKVLTPAMWDSLLEIAQEHGLWLFSDEVYRGLERGPALVQAADVWPRGISLNVMSKAYGLPGLRVGWIACQDRQLLTRMERVKHYLSICNAAPSELLATLALQHRETLLTRNRSLVNSNLQLLDAFFARHPDRFDWRAPQGGCVGFPRYLGADGVESWTRRLLEQHGILLLPASKFESQLATVPVEHFRVGYGRRAMAEGLAELEKHL